MLGSPRTSIYAPRARASRRAALRLRRRAAGGRAGGARLGGAKVAQLQAVRVRVHQQVLRLDVAVAHAQAVDVRERAAHLEHVQLHEQRGHALAGLGVVLADAVDRLRHKLEH
jgi:hypothetical protein